MQSAERDICSIKVGDAHMHMLHPLLWSAPASFTLLRGYSNCAPDDLDASHPLPCIVYGTSSSQRMRMLGLSYLMLSNTKYTIGCILYPDVWSFYAMRLRTAMS